MWSRGRVGLLILCSGGARRLDHQVHRQAVLDVVRVEGLVVLHDLAGEDEAQLIGLCVELLGDRLLELPSGAARKRERKKKQTNKIRDAELTQSGV